MVNGYVSDTYTSSFSYSSIFPHRGRRQPILKDMYQTPHLARSRCCIFVSESITTDEVPVDGSIHPSPEVYRHHSLPYLDEWPWIFIAKYLWRDAPNPLSMDRWTYDVIHTDPAIWAPQPCWLTFAQPTSVAVPSEISWTYRCSCLIRLLMATAALQVLEDWRPSFSC